MNRLFYGTWELDGTLKKIDESKAEDLIKYAKKLGINKFDTALAYGNGKVEKILSRTTTDGDIILTKVPAVTKPKLDSTNSLEYYPCGYVVEKVNESRKNLSRSVIDIVLLHNWSLSWGSEEPCLDELLDLKRKEQIKYIGISLPNNYNNRLSEQIVEKIDYVEAPFNIENNWIINDLNFYREHNVKVILRSIFLQGKTIKDGSVNVEETIKRIAKYDTYIAIGMTEERQIAENINVLEKVSENNEE